MSENRSVRIVLVRPRDPNNIGAVARVMANFGYGDLAVVDAWDPTWREAKAAVGASHVMESARSFDSLGDAIGDCTFVLATTSATRRRLDGATDPASAFERVREQGINISDVAIIFGNEKHGLTTKDLAQAHATVVIPTDRRQPSMNLGHAVAIMVWETTRILGHADFEPHPTTKARRERRATVSEIDRLIAAATGKQANGRELPRPDEAADRLRRILSRANVSIADVNFLFTILNKTSDNETTK